MRFFKLFITLFVATSLNANALNLVRDAEIEDYLYEISAPIFQSGSTSSDALAFYLVKDNSINAFVYGGQNIFINTGLIEASNTPNMLQGVISHEFGHIIGAHLVKSQASMQKSIATYAIATLLGVGMLIASPTNSGTNAAIASTMLGQHIAERQFLSFSRTQEAEADRYAMLFMKKSDISSNGMLELFKKLESVQSKYTKEIDKYSITHPLTTDRIAYFQSHINQGKKTDEATLQKHFFIQAKILAHSGNASLHTNTHTILNHPQYKAYYLSYQNLLENKNEAALFHINNLLKLYPHNPYFHETAAIIYTNLQQNQQAISHFKTAIELSQSNLVSQEYAAFLIKTFHDEEKIKEGIAILEDLKNTNEHSATLYQNLQYAYSKLNLKEYYLISRVEEIALFMEKSDKDSRYTLRDEIFKLKNLLKDKPNAVIFERLKRIEKIV